MWFFILINMGVINLIQIIQHQFHASNLPTSKQHLESIVNGIGDEVRLDKEIIVLVDPKPLSLTPAAAVSTGSFSAVLLSPFWLVDWEKLPDPIKVSGLKDPKLDDRNYYQQLIDWISEYQSLPKEKVNLEKIVAIRFFLRLREDPEKARKSFRSMIAHELGHIYHDHGSKYRIIALVVSTIAGAILFLGGIGMSLWLAFWAGISLMALAPLITLIAYKVIQSGISRHQERQADAFSVKHLNDSYEGAQFGFGCAKLAVDDAKSSRALTKWERFVSRFAFIKGDFLPYLFSHGSYGSRLRSMKKVDLAKNHRIS